MGSYRYTAVTSDGRRVAGVLVGPSELAVQTELEGRRLSPVSITAEAPRRGPIVVRRISARNLATAYTQMADLLKAGVPLLRALRLLGGRKSDPKLSAEFRRLAEAVAEGTDLGAAMADNDSVFPPVHVAMVRAGERGGFLELVLSRLGQLVQGQADLRAKVIGNLIYPAVLVVFGVLVLTAVFWKFVPMFRPMFAKLQLGWSTRLIFWLSDVVTTYALLAVGVMGVLVGAAWWALRRPAVRTRLARWQLHTPIIGELTRLIAVARFSRVLGTLLANSVPLLASLQVSKDAAGHPLLVDAIARAAEAVRHGDRLAEPLASSGLFSDDVVEMISVGESANNLDAVLLTIAATLEARVERRLSAAVKLIEPLMLVVLAGVIGCVAIGLISPMTNLSQLAGN